VAELCASAPIHIVEIAIFYRPALLSNSEGFEMFCENPDVVSDLTDIFGDKR
jgi:hypothetical protein